MFSELKKKNGFLVGIRNLEFYISQLKIEQGVHKITCPYKKKGSGTKLAHFHIFWRKLKVNKGKME